MNRPQLEELRDRLVKMPRFDRGVDWTACDWNGNERLEVYAMTANTLKYILDNTDAIVSALSAALAVEAVAGELDKPMPLEIALDFADNPRPYHTLQAPADTNGELYRALKMIAAAYRSALTPASSAVEGEAVATGLMNGPLEEMAGYAPELFAERDQADWWLVRTDMGKVIFHGPGKARADRVAAIHGRTAEPLWSHPAPTPAGEWQPIETAPHGVDVLLATPPFEYMGEQAKWELRVGAASWGERIGGISNISRDAHATHWQPLPEAPK